MALLLKFWPVLAMLAFAWFSMRRSEGALRRELDAKSAALADGPLLDAVQRFRGAIGIDALQVDIYDVPVINGLAAPDGRIFITRGLIDKYREGVFSLDEIAAVIAHEIGHLALGHHDRRKKAWQLETAARAAATALLPKLVSGPMSYVTRLLAQALHTRLSRVDEFQADAFAISLLKHAGFDPAAKISLLQKLDKLAEGRGRPISWLASHPPTPQRIEAVRVAINTDETP